MLSDQVADVPARRACRSQLSIVFAGAPGSGKTTMLSCCAAELDPTLRVVIAEEVFEADIPLPNVASMQTRAARPDRPAVDLRRLVAGFLRMAPDVAIVGEVRDREALPLLLTLSSGVKGFTTIHAGSARQALTRLRFVCQLVRHRRPAALRAQQPRQRGRRRRRPLRPHRRRAAGHRDRRGRGPGGRPRGHAASPSPRCSAGPGSTSRWRGPAASRFGPSARCATTGFDVRALARPPARRAHPPIGIGAPA